MSKQIHFMRDASRPNCYIVMYHRPDQDWHHRFNRTGDYNTGKPYGYPAIPVVYEAAVECEERTFWALQDYLTHEPTPPLDHWGWYIIPDLEAIKIWIQETDKRLRHEADEYRQREMEGSQISLF